MILLKHSDYWWYWWLQRSYIGDYLKCKLISIKQHNIFNPRLISNHHRYLTKIHITLLKSGNHSCAWSVFDKQRSIKNWIQKFFYVCLCAAGGALRDNPGSAKMWKWSNHAEKRGKARQNCTFHENNFIFCLSEQIFFFKVDTMTYFDDSTI